MEVQPTGAGYAGTVKDLDLDAVAALVRDISRRELLPRFGALAEGDVRAKPSLEDPSDIVTEADEAAERALEPELLALLPGSVVVGEEATGRDPSVRDAVEHAQWAWLVDPLDGTKNFAAGRTTFGTMVTLCSRGDAVAAWIHLPVTDETLTAERGSGAWCAGRRLLAGPPPDGKLRGTVFTTFMPPDVRALVEPLASARTTHVPALMSAAVEYTHLARGEKDFNLYWRLLPWDHAPGALLLTEAGGALRHPDGRAYRAADRDPFALAVRFADAWEETRAILLEC